MITIGKEKVYNLEGAFRGLRNPLASWNKSDSVFDICSEREFDDTIGDFLYENFDIHSDEELEVIYNQYLDQCVLEWNNNGLLFALLGPDDIKLAQKLIAAGSDHRKFMRQILVCMDIEAPIYWWKEMSTYQVATVANSTSTMHKLATTPITYRCFSFDNGLPDTDEFTTVRDDLICNCERLRLHYLHTKDPRYWRALVQLLPESWNQIRTWTANYETLRNIYFARRNHKLNEWETFCRFIESLPYAKELICYEPDETKGE